MELKINPQKEYQTFKSIGASGAWWAQIVGGWDHVDPQSGKPVRDRIAELLYNKETGIGMGVYRYNIGGGSKHSGKGEYSQPARATECFEVAKGKYDWSRDANAVYMMKKCVENGADEVIFFVNSPIERLTKNGLAHNKKHQLFHENISRKNYQEFAEYCLDVTEHFVGEGVPVKYLSPVNEPIWVWNGGQEGCFYRPRSVKNVFRVFAEALDNRKSLKGVKLSGAESGDLRWFNKSYTRQLLKDKNVRKHLDGVDVHSYCLPLPLPITITFLNDRIGFVKRFRRFMDKHYPDVPVVMSEWTHMQGGRDYGMDSALVTARTMYEDFTLLNAVSWQHWIAVSEVDYCDGLIYINLEDKSFELTKRYYVTGNYTRYVKPGSRRIEAHIDDNDVLVTAFKNNGEIILVVVNNGECEKEIELPEYNDILISVTDKDNSLAERTADSSQIRLTPKSVTTVVLK
ncbi:MAG: glycoside hydrolase family 30 protein [Clostridia bacterium]|nr:glycoside hydrolase family 30 protein [Clostridia bacterium]